MLLLFFVLLFLILLLVIVCIPLFFILFKNKVQFIMLECEYLCVYVCENEYVSMAVMSSIHVRVCVWIRSLTFCISKCIHIFMSVLACECDDCLSLVSINMQVCMRVDVRCCCCCFLKKTNCVTRNNKQSSNQIWIALIPWFKSVRQNGGIRFFFLNRSCKYD